MKKEMVSAIIDTAFVKAVVDDERMGYNEPIMRLPRAPKKKRGNGNVEYFIDEKGNIRRRKRK